MQKSVSSLSSKLEQAVTVRTEESVTACHTANTCCLMIALHLGNQIYIYSLIFQEVHRLQKEADEGNKRASVLERDNQRFEVQLADMAQQVKSNGTAQTSIPYARKMITQGFIC